MSAAPVRVLVVDDSVVARQMVSRALDGHPGVEVIGTASNGRLGVERVRQLRPDVVTLDVEMPVMDGLQALAEIRKEFPRLPVVMFSTLTERGASATLDALSLGASDYVTKPTQLFGNTDATEHIRTELLPKVLALGGVGTLAARGARGASLRPSSSLVPITAAPSPAGPAGPVDIVAIGVSTGGPNALAELLPRLPGNLRVPVVVVQHMPPVFTGLLATRLDSKCALRVEEAADGDRLEPGTVHLAPGGFHLLVEPSGAGAVARITEDPPEHSCRPAVDPLFRSCAATFGSHVLAVVLTGMGQDGSAGAKVVRAAGGRVLVQDEASSVVWGMPGFVAQAGLADACLGLGELAAEIERRVARSRSPRAAAAGATTGEPLAAGMGEPR